MSVLLVHCFEDLTCDLLGQLLQNVGKVISFETERQFGNLLGIELTKNLTLNIFVKILEDFSLGILVDQLPENAARSRRRGF
jgi:hypothetical protein